jgi:hypothetical protein
MTVLSRLLERFHAPSLDGLRRGIPMLPFILVLLASLLPVTGAYINRSLYDVPALLTALTYAVTLFLLPVRQIRMPDHEGVILALSVLAVLLTIQVLSGRGFVVLAAGGYVLIFAVAMVVLFASGPGISLQSVVRGTSFLYQFFLLGLVLETIIIAMGGQPRLAAILLSSNSPNYKISNSADFLRAIGLMQQAGGLNSILLGSQIAGMLSLFSSLWFMGIRALRSSGLAVGHTGFWIALSLLFFLMTINGLNCILFAAACAIYVFLSGKLRVERRFLFAGLILAGAAILYLLISNDLLFQRIFNGDPVHLQPNDIKLYENYGLLGDVEDMTTMQYYMHEFSSPLVRWLHQNWANELLGVGAQYFLEAREYVAGDFGFAIGVLSAGLLWGLIFVATLFGTCLPALRQVARGPQERRAWSMVASCNALISLLWLVSTLHYSQAFTNPGGMMFFALSFALTLYSRYRYLRFPQGGDVVTSDDRQGGTSVDSNNSLK